MIRSRSNERLKELHRALRGKGSRTVLEGPHLVGEALAAGLELDWLLATPDFLAGHQARQLMARLPRPPLEVLPELLDELLDSDSPRGLVALARVPALDLGAIPRDKDNVYLYACALQDPGNLGALARSAEAAGAAAMILGPGTVQPTHPRALRASAGSLLRLPVVRQVAWEELRDNFSELQPSYLALATSGGTDLYDAPLRDGTLVLCLGAEGPGLPRDLERQADLRLTIPIANPVESLNATVAAALTLFEIRRQRRDVLPGETASVPSAS